MRSLTVLAKNRAEVITREGQTGYLTNLKLHIGRHFLTLYLSKHA